MNEAPPTVELIDNRIYFYSEITPESAANLNKLLRKAEEDIKWKCIKNTISKPNIWLHINSPGGEVLSTLAIVDTIRLSEIPVYTIVEGYAGSGASMISISGNKRYILPNAFILMHQVEGGMYGSHEDFKDRVHIQKLIMKRMIKLYTDNTKLTKKDTRNYLKRDTWLDATKAKKLGFVDRILK